MIRERGWILASWKFLGKKAGLDLCHREVRSFRMFAMEQCRGDPNSVSDAGGTS
jgi:hypothetical protein